MSTPACSTRTELEPFHTVRRRALTFDLVGLCKYEVFNAYHSELLQHLQGELPPGYSYAALIQILRADRAAFFLMAGQVTSFKRDQAGELHLGILREVLALVLSKRAVNFHLLPLATAVVNKNATPNANQQAQTWRETNVYHNSTPKAFSP